MKSNNAISDLKKAIKILKAKSKLSKSQCETFISITTLDADIMVMYLSELLKILEVSNIEA